MSPATVIGSATPISGTGADLEGDLRNKVIENSVEKIRDLAALRGRNADWAEDAVRDGISAPSSEAAPGASAPAREWPSHIEYSQWHSAAAGGARAGRAAQRNASVLARHRGRFRPLA